MPLLAGLMLTSIKLSVLTGSPVWSGRLSNPPMMMVKRDCPSQGANSIRRPSSSCNTSTPTRRPSAIYSLRALTGVGNSGLRSAVGITCWTECGSRIKTIIARTRKPKTEIMPPAKMTQAQSFRRRRWLARRWRWRAPHSDPGIAAVFC